MREKKKTRIKLQKWKLFTSARRLLEPTASIQCDSYMQFVCYLLDHVYIWLKCVPFPLLKNTLVENNRITSAGATNIQLDPQELSIIECPLNV